jgi:thiamine pyrophosphate-dependent acetolactate synthase large subunit-like protein
MELEIVTRYQVPFVVLIINNNGLFMGIEERPTNPKDIGVTNLNP